MGNQWNICNSPLFGNIITQRLNTSARRKSFQDRVGLIRILATMQATVILNEVWPVSYRQMSLIEGPGLGLIVRFGEWVVKQN